MDRKHCDACDAEIIIMASPSRLARDVQLKRSKNLTMVRVRCAFVGDGLEQLELCDACAERFILQAFNRPEAGLPPEGWQPIATAPKDGTRVLTWYPLSNVAHTDSRRGDLFYGPGGEEPTHWMSLPAPPTAEGKAEAAPLLEEGQTMGRVHLVTQYDPPVLKAPLPQEGWQKRYMELRDWAEQNHWLDKALREIWASPTVTAEAAPPQELCVKCQEPEAAHGDFGFRDHEFVRASSSRLVVPREPPPQQEAMQQIAIMNLCSVVKQLNSLLERTKLYGPADALRDTGRQLAVMTTAMLAAASGGAAPKEAIDDRA